MHSYYPEKIFLCSAIFITVFSSCNPSRVNIPKPRSDQAPKITINNTVLNNTGTIPDPTSSDTVTLVATPGTYLLISGGAFNPGGVKSFSITITDPGNPVLSATVSDQVDANNQVADGLSIYGKDNAGHDLSFIVTDGKVVSVTASATNFNSETRTFTVTYLTASKCEPCPANEKADEHCQCACSYQPSRCGNQCCDQNSTCCDGECFPLGQKCCNFCATTKQCCGQGCCDDPSYPVCCGAKCCLAGSTCEFGGACIPGPGPSSLRGRPPVSIPVSSPRPR
jgi:hypothetical protein